MNQLECNWCVLIILLSVLTNGFAYPADQKECGGALSGLFGRLKSPNFPEKYPDNLRCSWNIAVPAGFYISLNFTQFDTENYDGCEYDYVVVKDKNNTVGRFCGNEKKLDSNVPRGPLFLKSNRADVQFITDHSNEEIFHGFEAHFAANDVDECTRDNGGCMHFCHNYIGGHYCTCKIGYNLAKDNRTCIVECKGSVLKDKEGYIQTPEYPNNYPPHADCEWSVAVEKGYSIVLEFEDFNIEEHPDYLCPYDWLRVQFADGFKALCGKNLPKKIASNTNWVVLNFHSDRDENRKGFKIRYYLESVKCPVISAPANGKMTGKTTFSFKDRLFFECLPGYDLVGSRVIECLSEGQWTAKPPHCKIKSCGKPPAPFGGSIVGNRFTYRSKVHYSCGVLYNLVGQNSTTCLANGSWSGVMPKCAPVCGRTRFPSDRMDSCRGRIVAGNIAKVGSHPWIAAIHRNDRIVCGGVLINDEWVLTAAHCITDRRNARLMDQRQFSVSLGRHRRHENGVNIQISRVAQMIKHPHFNHTAFNADIGLIRLDRRAKMTDYVRPVCLPTEKREKRLFVNRRNVMIAGWGSNGTGYSEILNEACIRLVSRRDCAASYAKNDNIAITDKMICAGNIGGTNVCKGDSGGPLVAYDDVERSWILGGIVSFGSLAECGSNYEVFARVTKLLPWIGEHVLSDLDKPFQ
ncbi:mannan-binding lectin serine protease 1-like [Rhopilema esculentum]|uniref:mannan-binding lectin serine protease 1-like n=1 Tax=Rhopilema esculentum TaxID=499914 RepID=UPI0031E1591E